MERKKKLKQKGISLMFTFILTLLLIVLLVCLDLNFGVFHDKSIIRKVNESNYYNEIYKELNKKAEKLVTEAGFPVSALQDVITLERVYINGKQYVETTLRGEKMEISTVKLQDKLLENMNEYLAGSNILLNKELTSGMEGLATDIDRMYQQGIRLEYIRYLAEYRLKYLSFIRWFLPGILLMIGAVSYFLIRMHPFRHRGIRYIDYALNAASLLAIGTAVYMLRSGFVKQTGITPEYYRNFLSLSLRWDYQVLLYLGCIGVAISLVLITLIGFMKNRISA